MKILVKRLYKKDTYTIGKLYIDGVFFCDTLEDKDRGLTSIMSLEEIEKIKVPGETAIPTGSYNLNYRDQSPRFKCTSWARKFNGAVPLICGVKGYSGVRIHPGNTSKDTEGCLLLGRNTVKGQVTQSQYYWTLLMEKLFEYGNAVSIEFV